MLYPTISRPAEAERIALLKAYIDHRREACAFRLEGKIELALACEARAGALVDQAASEDHKADWWERAIEKCDDLAARATRDPALWSRLIPKSAAERRRIAIDTLNRRFGIPSASALRVLAEKGYTEPGWGAWILDNADDCGLRWRDAAMIFDALGETEAFDGFVTSCQDYEGSEE